MAILRRVRTAIHALRASPGSSTNESSTKTIVRATSPVSTTQAVDSSVSVSRNIQQSSDIGLPDQALLHVYPLRSSWHSRLARKASIFSLRGKARRFEQQQVAKASKTTQPSSDLSQTIQAEEGPLCEKPHTPDHIAATSINLPSTPFPQVGCHERPLFPPRISSLGYKPFYERIVRAVKEKQDQRLREGFLNKTESHDHTFIRMASENASPPVPYSRLQEITVSVSCLFLSLIIVLTDSGMRKSTFINQRLQPCCHGRMEHDHHQYHSRHFSHRNNTIIWHRVVRATRVQVCC